MTKNDKKSEKMTNFMFFTKKSQKNTKIFRIFVKNVTISRKKSSNE